MKQLLARIDDELHRRLKERAVEQDRSLNDLVSSILADAVADDAASVRYRIDRSGLRVLPPAPASVRSRSELIERLRGTGSPLAEALAADRDSR